MFEQHDTELELVVGELAERMRPLGFAAPGACQAGDQATADLPMRRRERHRKSAWMLRRLVAEGARNGPLGRRRARKFDRFVTRRLLASGPLPPYLGRQWRGRRSATC